MKGRGRRGQTALVAFLLVAATALGGHDRAAARRAYGEAQEYLKKELFSLPFEERTAKRYDWAIHLFRLVVDHDPTYGASDDALYQIARLYDEKHQRFAGQSDLERAVHYYEFVSSEYPLTKHRAEALKRARVLQAAAAPAVAEEAPAVAPPAQAAGGESESAQARVERIRYWSGPDYTRVVIDLDREVDYRRYTLEEPYRIYFDLSAARLKKGIRHEVNDVFIKTVRAAQNRPDVVRVVLDFVKKGETTAFPLFDPFRIVIDTHSVNPAGTRRQNRPPPGPRESETVATAEIALEDNGAAVENKESLPIVPAPNISGDLSLTRTLGLKVGRVVLDPGHGGRDHGTIGVTGLKEKDLTLAIAKHLKTLLEERLHTDVVLTRTSDRFVPLEERTAIANQNDADLFVSIHANASRSPRARGVETFYLAMASTADEREVASRENAGSQRNIRELQDLLLQITKGDYNEESRDLAHVVQKALYDELRQELTKTLNRGVKRAPFIVLIGSNMPSILAEVGFLSNPNEEGYLKKDDGQEKVAEALFVGIEEYFRALGASAGTEAAER